MNLRRVREPEPLKTLGIITHILILKKNQISCFNFFFPDLAGLGHYIRPNFYAYTLEDDPSILQEALFSLDANLWQEAINDEMDSL